ncbi:DUF4288 domain-containing protein [Flaviaesturariibacter amylovorans]|uniref:DUF4288 domain-containing protein n=1 Tax=Flaviaesturariibacter amylovorans TaxID=1084520 RepID=A0ABP8HTD9_9BACT
MEWYLAKIVYRIKCGDGQHRPQFDEQLRLIAATGESDALSRARALGQQGEDRFFNQQQQLVAWQFVDVAELFRVEALDGAELYSQVTEVDEADDYLNFVHYKARCLEARPQPIN